MTTESATAMDAELCNETRGFSFLNPDTGEEWSRNHPVHSGEVEDATKVSICTYGQFLRRNAVYIVSELRRDVEILSAKCDAQMELVKACEHIAEGDAGWGTLRNLCPSTAAVSRQRDELERLKLERGQMMVELRGVIGRLETMTAATGSNDLLRLRALEICQAILTRAQKDGGS